MTSTLHADSVVQATAVEQARMIREKLLSSEELTRLYLERIEKMNPALGAWVEVQPERALFAARRKDAELRRARGEVPPFHGVPTGIKDMNFARGMWTRMGSAGFCVLSPGDDLLTRQIRGAGFVVLGKTATSELGSVPVVETDRHPPARNPWNTAHTAGGSSGGAGSAIAAGLIPIAPGSDGAGSVRIPSALCHLVGLKPSAGRVPNAFGLQDHDIIYTDGPMGRTVDDVAALLDVLSGITGGSCGWAPLPEASVATLSRRDVGSLRVRLVDEHPLCDVHPEVRGAVREVARKLEGLGHHVQRGVFAEGTVEEFLPVWQRSTADGPLADWSLAQPITRWLAEAGKALSQQVAIERKRSLQRRTLAWFEGTDIVVCPTSAVPPGRIGDWIAPAPLDSFLNLARYGYFTAPFNLSGQPAITVPTHVTSNGLPIGVQLVGAPLADGIVLALARQIEKAMPWHERSAFMLRDGFRSQ
jgi:amidase